VTDTKVRTLIDICSLVSAALTRLTLTSADCILGEGTSQASHARLVAGMGQAIEAFAADTAGGGEKNWSAGPGRSLRSR
jgi:hypothetical protein